MMGIVISNAEVERGGKGDNYNVWPCLSRCCPVYAPNVTNKQKSCQGENVVIFIPSPNPP
jgi:hypothetical protein